MASVYFIGSEFPGSPEKNAIDYSVAYGTVKTAFDAAKNQAKTKFGDSASVRQFAEDRLGVFVDFQGQPALLASYILKQVELIK